MDRLWSPWRLAYVTSNATKPEGCVFCAVTAPGVGQPGDPERDALVLVHGRDCYVILNLYPYNNGHLMVVPRRHIASLTLATAAELEELMQLTRDAEAALTEAYQPQGINVGKSLCEKDLASMALDILEKAKAAKCKVLLPVDVMVAGEFKANAAHLVVDASACPDDQMILDIGPKSIALYQQELADCATVVWNGPLGAFEIKPFDTGTVALALEVARLTGTGKLLSVAGGGDTVAALAAAGVEEKFSYVSTAGGAFLEWMEGKTLPGVAALIRAA